MKKNTQKQDNAPQKEFATPKQYAICSTIICVMIFIITGVILHSFGLPKRPAMICAAVAAVILYRAKYPLDPARLIKGFDVTVPVMTFLLNWTLCELCSSLYGRIASNFSAVEPNHKTELTVPAVLGSVIIAPLCEELIFRQCSMGLLKKCSGRLFTILFPTVAFTLMHIFYNPQGIVSIFAGTLAFAVCYYYTENVLYCIIAHLLHNLLCVPDFSFSYNNVNGYDILKPHMSVIYLVILAVSLIWLVKVFLKKYGGQVTAAEKAAAC